MDSNNQNSTESQPTADANSAKHLPVQPGQFTDRRNPSGQRNSPGFERRQFTNSHSDLSPEAAELGHAIDQYKLNHRRRFINYEEMLSIVKSLGYSKSE